MTEKSWAQLSIDRFFENRKSPSQAECYRLARSISNASVVRPVDVPGSLSYTVIGTGRPNQGQDLIVSFREKNSVIDSATIALARSIHGCLVPEATYHGKICDLHIYTMSRLQGISSLEALSTKAELTPEAEASHTCYVKHLARYFARCWLMPQPTNSEQLVEHRSGVNRRLEKLRKISPPIVSDKTINELECSFPVLFSHEYPQVLTHNDLSKTNILVNDESLKITGLIDWSLASVLPFGLELFSLSLMTGYMGIDGWHSYTCRDKLHNAFWKEFCFACAIDYDHARWKDVYNAAQSAARLGAVLHYAFERNADGSPSEEVATSQWMWRFLPVLLEL